LTLRASSLNSRLRLARRGAAAASGEATPGGDCALQVTAQQPIRAVKNRVILKDKPNPPMPLF